MLKIPGRYIGDAWYYVDDGTAHCYFLTQPDSTSLNERGLHWDTGHAVSTNLVDWEFVGLAMSRGMPGEWDGHKLSTGSVIKRDGRFWMAYNAQDFGKYEVPPRERRQSNIQRVGVAVSDDLYNWIKYEDNPVSEADPDIYQMDGTWRDPFMVEMDDRVYHYVCAAPSKNDVSSVGTVGLAWTNDMLNWNIEPPVKTDAVAKRMEVPQVYKIEDLYYLNFCTSTGWLLDDFKNQHPGHEFVNADYSMVSESPMGPFKMYGTGEIFPSDSKLIPYASQLINWKGEWVLLGTVMNARRGIGPDFVIDPVPIEATQEGIRAKI